MTDLRPLRIAILGAGPSGLFTTQVLIESGAAVEVDVIERLPVPFGLVRFGVAPDHPRTKDVSAVFEQTLAAPQVRFFGNVTVGRDIGLSELRTFYDALVLAFGAPLDAPLGIPGTSLAGFHGASAFVGWYNGLPEYRDLAPALDTPAVAIIGLGNVALDIARILAKNFDDLKRTDICSAALTAISRSPIEDIFIIGRRGALEAKFTYAELREMERLADAAPVVDSAQLAAVGTPVPGVSRAQMRNLELLRGFARASTRKTRKRVHFLFDTTPLEILGNMAVSGLRCRRLPPFGGQPGGDAIVVDIPCGAVISAVGFRSEQVGGLPHEPGGAPLPNTNGRVNDDMFVVGWLKRGPSGVIGTSRLDAVEVGQQILVRGPAPGTRTGRQGLHAYFAARGHVTTDLSGWRRIDLAERLAAAPGAPRRKIQSLARMLEIAGPSLGQANGGAARAASRL